MIILYILLVFLCLSMVYIWYLMITAPLVDDDENIVKEEDEIIIKKDDKFNNLK